MSEKKVNGSMVNGHSEDQQQDGSSQSIFEKIQGLLKASLRPLPTATGDGSYLTDPERPGLIQSILALRPRDASTLFELLITNITAKPLDDRQYLMERAVQLAQDLPLGSDAETKITDGLREILWNDLSHPPILSLREQDNYRTADGSNNNLLNPRIGAAGTPYARSVTSQTLQKRSLPDPGLIFDTVLARNEFQPHPNKISSVLFYLATIITHDLFNTDAEDDTINKNSSYLDLSPLYGRNQDEQNTIRTFSDGKLKIDSFADYRILHQPPGVGVFLIMFNRWHNHAVTQLASINENGRFTKPDESDVAGLKKYDEALFQTGRLITCNLYCNIIIRDYVRTILNLNRTNSSWTLDPRASSDADPHANNSFATGNQVSVEFNLVYRWHAVVSTKDETWLNTALRTALNGRDPEKVEWKEMLGTLRSNREDRSKDAQSRSFAGLKRNADGSLPDDVLAEIFSKSIEEVAGAFGPNQIPRSLRAVEILGILRARKWRLATLNEFRAHFKLEKHKTFEDINPDPKVANALKHLYDHPDFVELYPGLLAENAKEPWTPGSGLCPSFTMSRAILSDAVALVRGDRFFTTDCSPRDLTNWGFKESNFDIDTDHSHVMYKLILRAFPNSFSYNSVYAHFPFVIPPENETIHKGLCINDFYDYSRPSYRPSPIKIDSHKAAAQILDDPDTFNVTWGEKIADLVSHSGKSFGADFMLAGDGAANAKSRCVMSSALYQSSWNQSVSSFYTLITKDLLSRYSTSLAGRKMVDLVRDVINPAHAHFASELFCIPMKTETCPKGIYTEHEAYQIYALAFIYVFFDADPMKSFPLRNAAKKFSGQLGELVQGLLETEVNTGDWFGKWFDKQNRTKINIYGMHMLRSLLDAGYSVEELIWSHILPTATGMVANQGQIFSEVMEFYLRPENKHHWSAIVQLSTQDTKEADETLKRYILEASRLQTSTGVWRRSTKSATITDGAETYSMQPNTLIFVNLTKANHDATVFPNAKDIDLTRPLDSYLTFGQGRHACLGREMCLAGLTAMLKVFAGLKGLRKVAGPQGEVRRIDAGDGLGVYLAEDSDIWPFPATMRVEWDFERSD